MPLPLGGERTCTNCSQMRLLRCEVRGVRLGVEAAVAAAEGLEVSGVGKRAWFGEVCGSILDLKDYQGAQ